MDESMMGQYLADDMAFHMVLVRAAGNRRILKSVADSRVLTRLFSTGYTRPDLNAVTYTYISHRRILAAVRRSDAEAARQLMTRHIHGSSRVTLECYDQMHARANVNRPAFTGPLEGLMKQLNQIEESLGVNVSE
jgi:DNA-binding GntR family transcriptional regulator